jgi:hypothetical protein
VRIEIERIPIGGGIMKKTICLCGLALAVGIPAAFAADHLDSPTVKDEPTADITDLYSWMSPDAAMVNIVLNVAPFAGKSAQYSSAVQYAVHVNSSAGYGEAQTEATIVCQFYKEDAIECWLNDTYVVGDPTKAAGIMSDDGKLKVFAGLRDDPVFLRARWLLQDGGDGAGSHSGARCWWKDRRSGLSCARSNNRRGAARAADERR